MVAALALGRWRWGAGAGALALGRWRWGAGAGALALGRWRWGAGAGALALGRWRGGVAWPCRSVVTCGGAACRCACTSARGDDAHASRMRASLERGASCLGRQLEEPHLHGG